jgi:hypothetical protein
MVSGKECGRKRSYLFKAVSRCLRQTSEGHRRTLEQDRPVLPAVGDRFLAREIIWWPREKRTAQHFVVPDTAETE